MQGITFVKSPKTNCTIESSFDNKDLTINYFIAINTIKRK